LPALHLALVIFLVVVLQEQQANDVDWILSTRNDVKDQQGRFSEKYGRQNRFSGRCYIGS
jgi:hypothetical protein